MGEGFNKSALEIVNKNMSNMELLNSRSFCCTTFSSCEVLLVVTHTL